ncbi:hypothetical protein IMCC20628_02634 [Hoeflea sp. IMCC20628]|nr:hypothetical protein IMCC20628_02634 [Hoeflea sp. IMCC20628]
MIGAEFQPGCLLKLGSKAAHTWQFIRDAVVFWQVWSLELARITQVASRWQDRSGKLHAPRDVLRTKAQQLR